MCVEITHFSRRCGSVRKVLKPGVKLDKKYNGHLTPEKKLVDVGEAKCSLLRGRGGSPTTFTSVLR